MKAGITSLAVLVLTMAPANSQTRPFDMSAEKPAAAAPAQSVGPAPAQPDVPAINDIPVAADAQAEPARRFLVPFAELVFSGEYAQRSWSIFLTPEQAASKADLHLGYQNAVVVAPEASRLKLSVVRRCS